MERVREDTTTKQTKSSSQEEDAWDKLLNAFEGSNPRSGGAQQGDTLVKTQWGQSFGNKMTGGITFNHFCPPKPNGDAGNSPAGCTAVAMAQVLNYWACRVDPTGYREYEHKGNTLKADFGNTIYDWRNMLYVDSKGDTLYNIANEQNSLLIYHAGVSCKMDYRNKWSYAPPGRARDALVNYWGMKPEANVKQRIGHLRKWGDMLQDEITAGRPVIYSGIGSDFDGLFQGEWDDLAGGHSWVVDGFDSNDLFHCNWGWRGYCDGWYSLKKFAPHDENTGTDQGNYSLWEMAIFNVEPIQPEEVGIPTFNDTYTLVDYSPNGMELTVNPSYGATSYEWVTDKGVIKSDGSNRATLYTTETTHVKVCAYNELCGVYSDYAQNNVYIEGEPYISSEYRENESENDREIMRHYVIKEMIPNASVTWSVSNTADFEIVSTDNERVSIRCNTPGKTGVLKAHIPLRGFNDIYLETTIQAQPWYIKKDANITCGKQTFTPSAVFPNTEYLRWSVSDGINIISGENDTTLVVNISGDNQTEWVQLEVLQNGMVQTTSQTLNILVPRNVSVQVVDRWEEDGKQKALLYADLYPKGWYAYYDWRIKEILNEGALWGNPFGYQIEACMEGYTRDPWIEEIDTLPGKIEWSAESSPPESLVFKQNSVEPLPPLDDLPPMIPTTNPAYAVATFPLGEDAKISCTLETSCKTVTDTAVLQVLTHPASYSASYNRSTRSIQLDRQEDNSTVTVQGEENYLLQLYNNFGLVRTLPFDPTERRVSLPLGDLPDGSYYVNVVDGQGEVLCKQYISAY